MKEACAMFVSLREYQQVLRSTYLYSRRWTNLCFHCSFTFRAMFERGKKSCAMLKTKTLCCHAFSWPVRFAMHGLSGLTRSTPPGQYAGSKHRLFLRFRRPQRHTWLASSRTQTTPRSMASGLRSCRRMFSLHAGCAGRHCGAELCCVVLC